MFISCLVGRGCTRVNALAKRVAWGLAKLMEVMEGWGIEVTDENTSEAPCLGFLGGEIGNRMIIAFELLISYLSYSY